MVSGNARLYVAVDSGVLLCAEVGEVALPAELWWRFATYDFSRYFIAVRSCGSISAGSRLAAAALFSAEFVVDPSSGPAIGVGGSVVSDDGNVVGGSPGASLLPAMAVVRSSQRR